MGQIRLKDVTWLLAILTLLAGMTWGFILLRQKNSHAQTMRGAALEAIDNVVYVHDVKADKCFAFTWMVAQSQRVYLFAWVPCQLPVATSPVPALDEVVPL